MTDFHKIQGVTINNLEFSPIYMGDIIEFEGPILSHYVDEKQKNYLLYILDHQDSNNQSVWLLFSVSISWLYEFLKRKRTLSELITENRDKTGYITWCNEKGDHLKYRIININNLPKKYLPEKESLFDYRFKTDYYDPLIKTLRNSINVKTKHQETTQHGLYVIYQSIDNDINVLRSRVLTQLLEPMVNSSKIISESSLEAKAFQLLELGSKIDQDPFGNVFNRLMNFCVQKFEIKVVGKSKQRQFNDIVYLLTKELGESMISQHAPKRNRIYVRTYINFLDAVNKANLNVPYYDITKEEKFQRLKEELEP